MAGGQNWWVGAFCEFRFKLRSNPLSEPQLYVWENKSLIMARVLSRAAFTSGTELSRELVVLAHGFLGGRVQLLPIAASLARQYDVLNFGYRSRADTLNGHSRTLVDTLKSRLGRKKQTVHFVTHSFGGVVLHNAFRKGLVDVLGDEARKTRCVMIGPPLRGASFARAFQVDNLVGPEMVKNALHVTARTVLGEHSGGQLMMKDPGWFERTLGTIPEEVAVLVIAGSRGKLNPLISGESDGVVAVEETMLNRRHFRLKVGMSHNLLLYTPEVITSISEFLDGNEVGELVDRKVMETAR